MAIIGKGVKSKRKKDLQSQKELSVYKRIQFAHKASGGDTGVNLTSLTTPTVEMPAFVQATPSEIASSRIMFNKKNLNLSSSIRGLLNPYLDYTVASNTRINFSNNFGTALPGEIFIGTVESTDRVGGVIAEIDAISFRWTLPANTTDIPLGKPIPANKNPNEQIGAVLIFVDGVPQARNVGNATASPSANGNYEEVDNGGGLCTIIRLNQADPINDRNIVVVSNGFMAIRPTESVLAAYESLAGQVDLMVTDLASLASKPTTAYQAAPNSEDNKAFAERVFALEDVALPAASPLENGGHVTNTNQIFGGRKSAGNSKVRAAMSGTQTIATDASTEVIFATELSDTNNEYSTSTGRFTPTRAGYYVITAYMYVTFASGYCRVRIWKNFAGSAELLASERDAVNANGMEVTMAAGPVYMNGTTDYISVSVERPTGIATDVSGESRFYAYELV